MIRRETYPQPQQAPNPYASLGQLTSALPNGMVPLGIMPMPSFPDPMVQARQIQELLDASWQQQNTIAAQDKRIRHLEKKMHKLIEYLSRNPKVARDLAGFVTLPPEPEPEPEPAPAIEEAPSFQQVADDARAYNLEVSKNGDPDQFFRPVPGLNGQIPPGFPECAEELKTMKGRELRVIFNAYGIEDSFLSIRRKGDTGDADVYDVMNRIRLAEEIGASEFKDFFEETLKAE